MNFLLTNYIPEPVVLFGSGPGALWFLQNLRIFHHLLQELDCASSSISKWADDFGAVFCVCLFKNHGKRGTALL